MQINTQNNSKTVQIAV